MAMKRKLDQTDTPRPDGNPLVAAEESAFERFALDYRLLQGVAKQQFAEPTPVQSEAIPLALEGKDILARAKTGSGKTVAYLLPILHLILKRKAEAQSRKCTSALILVPTRELAEQVYQVVVSLTAYCVKDVQAVNLTHKVPESVQRSLLADLPDIVIATPARAALNITSSTLSLKGLCHLVIDEADLVLSYGYEQDLQNVSSVIPKGVQTFLMSATLTNEVDSLKSLFCRDPVILKLDEQDGDQGALSQYVVRCGEDEKFLLIYVIFKLQLLKGKCIIFLADIDRCYRLKLYLEQYGTKSCILNSELPVNSRIHVVEQFNKNVYDIIIASDEHEIVGDEDEDENEEPEEPAKKKDTLTVAANSTEEPAATNGGIAKRAKKRKKFNRKDSDYGVSRGIDFKNVACVINFDLPTSSRSYTHRIGRTARAGNSGMALSFAVPRDLYRKHRPTSIKSAQNDDVVLERIMSQQAKLGKEIKPYAFDMAQVEAFRYRMNDALRAVTGVAVREARTREIRQELLNSEKLKQHFEENPGDLHHLRHDGELRAARIQPHLKHVPDYLLPEGGKQKVSAGDVGFVGFAKTSENRIRKAHMQKKLRGKGKRGGGARKVDPLKSFKTKGRRS
ncbi:MAG: ATP-dependent DNA/RNA helicase [Sarcosagium campestre]|nr:MAG: ATP-dependent DNA/RNA helicase [Sarcosagium campestre]